MNKRSTRVDLTPMVDLGFLLITFFVFTTQLSQPTVMHLNMPFDKVPPGDLVCTSCVLTLLLEADNKIQYYEGMINERTVLKETYFAPDGIRSIILQKKKEVEQVKGKSDDFVLIIKSADNYTFQNFVNIADEVAINNVKYYYIDDLNAADKQLSAQNRWLYNPVI